MLRKILLFQVEHLSTMGGGTLKIMTKRILKRTLTSKVAVEYNWTGAKGKLAFQQLRISTVILRKCIILTLKKTGKQLRHTSQGSVLTL